MMDFFDDILLPIGICGAFIFAGLFTLFMIGGAYNKIECANLQAISKRHTEFRWFGGCFVENEGEMLPYDKWKLLDVRIKERK